MSNIAQLMFNAAAGAGGACPNQYWIALLGDTDNDYAQGVTVDSECNIIAVGMTLSSGSGSTDALITKYDPYGDVLWSRTLGGSSGDQFYDVAVDSEDNIYAVGNTASFGYGASDALITKYDPSGTLQWKRVLAGSGAGASNFFHDVAVDSSDNIVVHGVSNVGSTYVIVTAKYNSSGVLQWCRRLNGGQAGRGVAIDSSDNIIVAGHTTTGSVGSHDGLIAKYNSSGVLQWEMQLGSNLADYFRDVAVDSSDNIYVVGDTGSDPLGFQGGLIAKYDSSGTFQWDKCLGAYSYEYLYGVAIDSEDNIICCGYTDYAGEGGFDILIAKYDSSGAIQWQKLLGGTSVDYGIGVTTDSSDNIIIAGRTESDGLGGVEMLVAKLPPDGEADGTYGSLVYQDASLTNSNISLTNFTSTVTEDALTVTEQAATLTDAEAVLTEELFEITP